METTINKIFKSVIVAVLSFQLVGCGTLLYPERRGQKAGHLDAGVVILDAIGLLFFLIPGIIAFAVDFSNGTIYLPALSVSNNKDLRQVKFDPKTTSIAQIETIIKDETGRTVKLTQSNIKITRLNSKDEMLSQFAQVSSEMQENRLALAK